MYATTNYKTKKALKDAVKAGGRVGVYQPNDMGFNPPIVNGRAYLSGPWYPAPHSWYAQVDVADGIIVRVR